MQSAAMTQANWGGPTQPRAAVVSEAQGAEEGEIVEPGAVSSAEGVELVAPAMPGFERIEGLAQSSRAEAIDGVAIAAAHGGGSIDVAAGEQSLVNKFTEADQRRASGEGGIRTVR